MFVSAEVEVNLTSAPGEERGLGSPLATDPPASECGGRSGGEGKYSFHTPDASPGLRGFLGRNGLEIYREGGSLGPCHRYNLRVVRNEGKSRKGTGSRVP